MRTILVFSIRNLILVDYINWLIGYRFRLSFYTFGLDFSGNKTFDTEREVSKKQQLRLLVIDVGKEIVLWRGAGPFYRHTYIH